MFAQFINENNNIDFETVADDFMSIYSDALTNNGLYGITEFEEGDKDFENFVNEFFTKIKTYAKLNKLKKPFDTEIYKAIENNKDYELLEFLSVGGYFGTDNIYDYGFDKNNPINKLIKKYSK